MTYKLYAHAALRGLAQISFSDKSLSGILVLLAIAFVAPWSAVGAGIGCLAGTIAARLFRPGEQEGWALGWYGYNPAIVGILWGGVLGRGGSEAGLFVMALAVCILLDFMLRPALARVHLPPLALAAVLTAWGSDWIFRTFAADFWSQPGLLPLGGFGVAVGVFLILIVLARDSLIAAAQTVLLAVSAVFIAAEFADIDVLASAGLWAFAIAPAAFAPPAIMLAGTAAGGWAGVAAAAIASLIWTLWVTVLPAAGPAPLLMPAILGIWCVLGFQIRCWCAILFDPALRRMADALEAARATGRPAVVLTGAGVSTASGIPDYMSGAWLDPKVPVANYGYHRLTRSRSCRQQYWDACARFRAAVTEGTANRGHLALAALEQAGYLGSIITQNVDGYHQAAGSRRVIELHGNIHGVRCLSCGRGYRWPENQAWHNGDLACPSCGGLLKPAVIAFEENLLPGTWNSAVDAVARCGMLVVVGTRIAVSTAARLVAEARRHGIPVVFINLGPVSAPFLDSDLMLHAAAEEALPALRHLIGCSARIDSPAPRRGNMARPAIEQRPAWEEQFSRIERALAAE